jgi:tetratricopeptide (TPR) repeat protein
MPPITQQQTSRGGLITALVVSIVFALGFLIWAFMNNAELTKLQQQVDTNKSKYGKVISDSNLSAMSELQAAFSADPEKPRTGTLVDSATAQRNSLVRMIRGSEGSEAEARVAADSAMKAVGELKDAAIPVEAGLAPTVNTLAAKVKTDQDAIAAARKSMEQARADLEQAKKSHADEIAKRDQAVADAQAGAQKAAAEAKTATDDKQKQVDEFSGKVAEAQKQLGEAQQQAQVELQTLQRNLEKANKDYQAAISRIPRSDTKNAMIRNVDATISSVAPDNVCYINLGYGDHVVPGLTFEVYDKLDGIPKLGDGLDTAGMPKGKAAIEIINVGQNSCQCRIIRTTAGMTVTQGDLCANLVFDRNVKPVFYVYGKFDMDQNNVATEGEAEIIKNLIARWGGRVADKLNIDVDFVIMGKEPQIPQYSPEELQQPIPKAKFDEAQAQLKAWTDMRNNAVDLHIPIMNQNRFLYYTGYFEASKR